MTIAGVCSVLLGLAFIGAGIMHFVKTASYVYIMPPYLPYPVELVWISGVFEILGGLGIIVPVTRLAAGWGLIALLIAVYPANIHMAVNNVVPPGMHLSRAFLFLRLPVQFVLMWMVWWCCIRR